MLFLKMSRKVQKCANLEGKTNSLILPVKCQSPLRGYEQQFRAKSKD